MDRVPLQSSNVESAAYDEEQGILEVEYAGGAVYEYYRVPQGVFSDLVASASPGRFLATHVKGVYKYRRIR